jgi:glucosylceramidase
MKKIIVACLLAGSLSSNAAPDISWWLTKGDQSALLLQQKTSIPFDNKESGSLTINVDTTKKFQRIDGFGFALTGSSAWLISRMDNAAKTALLNELFSDGSKGSIGISTLRISIGASDLSPSVYTYDDMSSGQTDPQLSHFDLGKDKEFLVPLLQQILKINPRIKIVASPWSAPAWMKDNNNMVGGSLKPEYYKVYADYFVKYLQAMQQAGIAVEAITPQNEPLNPHNNPSMSMTAAEQLIFLKGSLLPALKAAGLKTKVIIYDHNCDNIGYPAAILRDETVRNQVMGTAFHLYAGNISAMGELHNQFPDRNVYFTEQYTDAKGDFGGDIKWHLKNVITGAMRNWSRNVIEWNLANDPNYGPHTQGGCNLCKGALTISGSSVKRNVSYYIIAHASKFVPAGSVRIWSDNKDNLNTVAFLTPSGKTVLITENDGATDLSFNIKFAGKTAACTIPAGSAATYVW